MHLFNRHWAGQEILGAQTDGHSQNVCWKRIRFRIWPAKLNKTQTSKHLTSFLRASTISTHKTLERYSSCEHWWCPGKLSCRDSLTYGGHWVKQESSGRAQAEQLASVPLNCGGGSPRAEDPQIQVSFELSRPRTAQSMCKQSKCCIHPQFGDLCDTFLLPFLGLRWPQQLHCRPSRHIVLAVVVAVEVLESPQTCSLIVPAVPALCETMCTEWWRDEQVR